MAHRGTKRNVHFDPKIKEVTISMWLEGKSEEEIEFIIRKLARKKYTTNLKRRSNSA